MKRLLTIVALISFQTVVGNSLPPVPEKIETNQLQATNKDLQRLF